jgi:hypothetical protein
LLGLCIHGTNDSSDTIANLLIESVNGVVYLLAGLLAVLVNVLLSIRTVSLELGVKLASLVAGLLDLFAL